VAPEPVKVTAGAAALRQTVASPVAVAAGAGFTVTVKARRAGLSQPFTVEAA
jgi:hypothetical protein